MRRMKQIHRIIANDVNKCWICSIQHQPQKSMSWRWHGVGCFIDVHLISTKKTVCSYYYADQSGRRSCWCELMIRFHMKSKWFSSGVNQMKSVNQHKATHTNRISKFRIIQQPGDSIFNYIDFFDLNEF